MNFKKWVKSIQIAGYNGARMLYTRAAGMYEDIRTGPHRVFRIQLTLSQPGGADYAHHSTTVLTMLKYVPAALIRTVHIYVRGTGSKNPQTKE